MVTEHVLPSVVRTEAAKAAMGCRPSSGRGFLRINFANKSDFPKSHISQARSEELAGAAGLPWLVEPIVA